MPSLLVIVIGTVLVNTFLLMQNDAGLGGSRASGSVARALRIGAATAMVLVLSTIAAMLIWLSFDASRNALLFVFSLAVVAVAVSLERLANSFFHSLVRAFAVSPLLIVSNSIAIGTAPLGYFDRGFLEAITVAIGMALAFAAALSLFVALVARIGSADVPDPFRGTPITMVSAGLLALALMGFTGIFRG